MVVLSKLEAEVHVCWTCLAGVSIPGGREPRWAPRLKFDGPVQPNIGATQSHRGCGRGEPTASADVALGQAHSCHKVLVLF